MVVDVDPLDGSKPRSSNGAYAQQENNEGDPEDDGEEKAHDHTGRTAAFAVYSPTVHLFRSLANRS